MQLNEDSAALGGSSGELIPAGTICLAVFKLQGVYHSGKTGGAYAKAELTIASGQHQRRKMFINAIMNPDDERNSVKAREMGQGAIVRMLEACGAVKLGDLPTYVRYSDFQQALEAIDTLSTQGKYIAVRIKIEKGESGYSDKNAVADYLSPNPKSKSIKDWEKLQGLLKNGDTLAAGTVANRTLAYGGATAGNALTAPTWAGNDKEQKGGNLDDEIPF